MIFIGGINSGVRQLEYEKMVICGRCGAYGRYQVCMTYLYFSFFFIPLFKWNRRYFVTMSCCGAEYELDQEVGRALFHGASVDIREENLTLCREGNGNPWESRTIPEGNTRKCATCGYETKEDFSYCPKCGSRME